MTRLDHTAFLQGETAYTQKKPITSNPYNKENPWESKKYDAWHKGWMYKKSRVELYPRRKDLEREEEISPNADFSQDWLSLAKDFLEVEDTLNESYCMIKYRKNMKKVGKEIPDEYKEVLIGKPFDFKLGKGQKDWQTRKDTK